MSTDPRRLRLAAGTSGGKFGFMDSFMKIKERQWKAGTEYNEEFDKADFDKAGNMFQKMQEYMNLFGVFGEFLKPFLMLLEVFDAALIEEYSEEIQNLNEAVASLYDEAELLAEMIHSIDWSFGFGDIFGETFSGRPGRDPWAMVSRWFGGGGTTSGGNGGGDGGDPIKDIIESIFPILR